MGCKGPEVRILSPRPNSRDLEIHQGLLGRFFSLLAQWVEHLAVNQRALVRYDQVRTLGGEPIHESVAERLGNGLQNREHELNGGSNPS